MKVKINLPFGKTSLQAELDVSSTKDFIEQFAWYSELPTHCGHCKSGELVPVFRIVKTYKYYQINCRACRYEYKYGQLKQGGELFPKGEWTPPYSSSTDDGQFPPIDDEGPF